MPNFPDIDPDDPNENELTPEDKETLKSYDEKVGKSSKRWSIFKAKENIEKDHLNGILDYLQRYKSYTKRQAFQTTLRMAKALKYSKKIINQFAKALSALLFDDY